MSEYTVDLTIETAEPLTTEALFAVAAIGGAAGGNVGEHRLRHHPHGRGDRPFPGAIASAIDRLPVRGTVVAVEATTTAEADRRLAEPPFPDLAGVAEVAAMLGVSRQRLDALRKRHEFPAPVANLAAGPVWRKGDLTRFADGWHRKPGRPPKLCA